MKSFFKIIFIMLFCISLGYNIKHILHPYNFKTQAEMIDISYKISNNIDKDFENTCNKIIKHFNSDKDFIESFNIDKQEFIKYRKTHLNTIFPATDKSISYGTNYPIYYNSEYNTITQNKLNEYQKTIKTYCSYNHTRYPEYICSDKALEKLFK